MTTALAASCALALWPQPGLMAQTWRTPKDFHGEIKRSGGFDPSQNVSGLACAPAEAGRRLCLVVDDESQGAEVVWASSGALTTGGYIPLIAERLDGKPVELDAEAVTYADGAFYVTGSHGRPRHEVKPEDAGDPEKVAAAKRKAEAKAIASQHVFRIRFERDAFDVSGQLDPQRVQITSSSPLLNLIPANTPLARAVNVPLVDDGLTIEGLAICGSDLMVGFRGPVPGREANMLRAPLSTLLGGGALPAKVEPLKLGDDASGTARGIRDLAAHNGGLLVLAGPVQDPPDDLVRAGDYAIYSWPSGRLIQTLAPFPGEGGRPSKPEGLLLLDGGGAASKALLVFDGPSNGAPKELTLDLSQPPEGACASSGAS